MWLYLETGFIKEVIKVKMRSLGWILANRTGVLQGEIRTQIGTGGDHVRIRGEDGCVHAKEREASGETSQK